MTKLPPQHPDASSNEEELLPNWISISRLIYQDKPIEIPVLAEAIDNHNVQTFDDTGRRILATDGDESDYLSKAWAKKHLSIRHNLKIDPIPDDELYAFHEKLQICGDPLDNFGWPRSDLPDFTQINPHVTNNNTHPRNSAPAKSNLNSWIEHARQIALKYIKRHIEQDLHPTQDDVSNHVAEELRKQKIHGPQGPVSSQHVKRQAIQGDWWQKNKRGQS